MSRLRELLVELIGAEVQAHTVTLNGKAKTLHFRQFDDATGQRIFAVVEGESAEMRGLRVMRSVLAASLCDEQGQLAGSFEEVSQLPVAAVQALFPPAAATNNISTPSSALPEAVDGPADADPGDEATGPNA